MPTMTNLQRDRLIIESIRNPFSTPVVINRSYSTLYNKYSSEVRAYINHLLRSIDSYEKEELHSAVMIRALSKINQFNTDLPFEVWLKSIARNATIDFLRRKKQITQSLDGCGYEYEDMNTPDQILEAKQTGNIIRKFINEQNESYREILKLRFEHGFSCRSISDRLDLPVGTISTVLFRSRNLLRNSGLLEK
jgi:RNA polymerase sigma-70 factor (ECF subfamily)